MAHTHSVYDNDTHFVISHINRGFTNEGSLKTLVVQNDHNSERFTFELPRYIEGHDMLLCNRVEVHYLNVDGQTKDTASGVYEVEDLQESPEDENIAILSWLISSHATQYVGSLNFCIRFACVNEETSVLEYSWSTVINSNIHVTSGINNAEVIIREYADVLEQWKKDITSNIYDFLPEHLQIGSEMAEILPPTSDFMFLADGMAYLTKAVEGIEDGKEYIINYNGVDYVSTSKEEINEDGLTLYYLGNIGLVMGGEDNGLPFAMIVLPQEAFEEEGVGAMLVPLDGATSVTLGITVETIKKLDSKYIDAEWMATSSVQKNLVNESEYTFKGNSRVIMPSNDECSWIANLNPSAKHIVDWNGIEYETKLLSSITDDSGQYNVKNYVLGNLVVTGSSAPGLEDTGEPFCIMYQQREDTLQSVGTTIFKDVMSAETITMKVYEVVDITKKLPYKFNTEPIIFTTTDMQSATCNKTYQECREAIENNFFTSYFVMFDEGMNATLFTNVNINENTGVISFVLSMNGVLIITHYNLDNTIELTMQQ